jgi:glucose-6-phosphate 1-dehydrogenase
MPKRTTSGAKDRRPLSIIIIGASGDLALKKIMPALFALHCQGHLPERFQIVGYARTRLNHEEFRNRVAERLTCRYTPDAECADRMAEFLANCSYIAGDYNSAESFRGLHGEIARLDPDGTGHRIFYLSIPPFLYLQVARAIADAGLAHRGPDAGWTRVVVEKPFGSDRASSDELSAGLSEIFAEEQTYRIDHYLGKEVIQNLMVLRFANLIFDPIWNRSCVHSVRISWSEEIGVEGRSGYFDQYGIIRDVMQNHLVQILSLVAMEQPIGLEARHVRDEKVKALRCIPPVQMDDIVVGQYLGNGAVKGYLEEEGVPPTSTTPTYAAAVLHVKNRRWDGVPFLIRAGKGLNHSMTEIRIRFHHVPGNIFAHAAGHLSSNQLVIRVQPEPSISFRIINKIPGVRLGLDESFLNLSYASQFSGEMPEAYESLLLDVMRGDESLFIRNDELEAAWDIFTPVLHELEERNIKPRPYRFGSKGPDEADALATRYGVNW